ncbi:MAG: ring-hydroxylating oxygenase subunit alpha, partial [Polaromonas sp.]
HILQAVRDLQNKRTEPKAVAKPASYKMRSGGWVANNNKDLATVMVERFGQKFGIVEQQQ